MTAAVKPTVTRKGSEHTRTAQSGGAVRILARARSTPPRRRSGLERSATNLVSDLYRIITERPRQAVTSLREKGAFTGERTTQSSST